MAKIDYVHVSSVHGGSHVEDLFDAAKFARLRAYAPYSKFMVGTALLAADGGSYHVGCNVECANYDVIHGEDAALVAMVMAAQRAPLIVANAGGLEGTEPYAVMSCGKCRQKLMEFSSLSGWEIHLVAQTPPEEQAVWGPLRLVTLSSLLPMSFGPADVGVDLTKYRR